MRLYFRAAPQSLSQIKLRSAASPSSFVVPCLLHAFLLLAQSLSFVWVYLSASLLKTGWVSVAAALGEIGVGRALAPPPSASRAPFED
jgi:hypothetical protein